MADVEVEVRGPALWVTLNRPDRRNAYDADMAAAVVEALVEAPRTSRGGHHRFGQGLLRRRSTDEPRLARPGGHARPVCGFAAAVRRDPDLPAAGHRGGQRGRRRWRQRAGGGLRPRDRGAVGDVRADRPAGRSSPVTGATNVMGIQIGEKKAKELAMLCRRYSAEQALEMGLVNAVVDDDALVATVDAWVGELAALSPRYLEITKVSSNIWWNAARDSFLTGLGMLTQAVGSDDMVEGAAAFMAKRKPDFPDPA